MPSCATSRTSASRLPIESWAQPGIEAIGLLTFSPWITNSG